MNGVISFVIFCDWLLLLSVCFWGLSVLQHAPVLHLSPPPRFFLSVRLCSPFIHSCGRGSGCLLTSHSAYVYWLLLCTRHRLRRILLHAVHSAFVINMSHMRTLRFSFLFFCLYVCVCVFKYLFIYFWLLWVFLAAWAFSGVASGATLRCSVWAYCDGFPRGAQALGTRASLVVALGQAWWLWCAGLVAPWCVESSQARDQTRVPCIERQFLNHGITGKPWDMFYNLWIY